MKTIIAITLVLLGANQIHATIIDKCWTEEEMIRKTYVDKRNEARQNTARIFQIANMHAMKYDDGLAKRARKTIKSCADLKNGPDYQLFTLGREESNKVWKEYRKKNLNITEDIANPIEGEHPLQTAYAKCNLTVTCTMNIYYMGRYKPHNRSEITLYAYKGTLTLDDIKFGPAGSQCPHGVTDKNLCIAPPRAKEENDSESGEDGEGGEGIGGKNMATMVAVNSIFVYLSIWLVF
ncbi:hypothetical protein GCK72_008608 [Caenorhabditis remanei]|uniref:SCP domain-containing protein n=1 Tax=Caenorhabditis remanei TaxID=31234 RepID=A0A6A5H060_CAERE|nr:hypothetical protein GCK72_008608 [Caenorhabditis remanei]KAF1760359.1 hypothetical protein GCK72_008608 [Caenorhabditis remanei]